MDGASVGNLPRPFPAQGPGLAALVSRGATPRRDGWGMRGEPPPGDSRCGGRRNLISANERSRPSYPRRRLLDRREPEPYRQRLIVARLVDRHPAGRPRRFRVPRCPVIGRTCLFLSYATFVFAPLVHNFAHVSTAVYPECSKGHAADSSRTHHPDEPADDPTHDHRTPCPDSCVFCQLFRSWSIFLTDPDQPWVLIGRECAVAVLTPEPPYAPDPRPPLIRGPPLPATI